MLSKIFVEEHTLSVSLGVTFKEDFTKEKFRKICKEKKVDFCSISSKTSSSSILQVFGLKKRSHLPVLGKKGRNGS